MKYLATKHATKVLSIPVHDLDSIPGFPACPCQFSPQDCITTSLIPAFSPRRRRIVRRLLEKPATELAGPSSDNTEQTKAVPSPRGEKVRMRADVKTIPFPPFVVAHGGGVLDAQRRRHAIRFHPLQAGEHFS
jgi:hypothetical protein